MRQFCVLHVDNGLPREMLMYLQLSCLHAKQRKNAISPRILLLHSNSLDCEFRKPRRLRHPQTVRQRSCAAWRAQYYIIIWNRFRAVQYPQPKPPNSSVAHPAKEDSCLSAWTPIESAPCCRPTNIDLSERSLL